MTYPTQEEIDDLVTGLKEMNAGDWYRVVVSLSDENKRLNSALARRIAELGEAKRDTIRLDWLQAGKTSVMFCIGKAIVIGGDEALSVNGSNLRQIIDLARRAPEGDTPSQPAQLEEK